MNLAVVHSRARIGVEAPSVRVEVHLGGGLPAMSIVGLPEAAVREAKDRVRAAIQCAQFDFPARRITINLAPADLPKDGARFDLAIALGILAASGQLSTEALEGWEFLGELALTGALRGCDGALPAALAAGANGHRLIVPPDIGAEAALASGVEVRCARTLLEVCAALEDRITLPLATPQACMPAQAADLADVRGQPRARRALEIAAAGGHHLLLIGPPGSGKTLLASRLAGILPELSETEALEAASIASTSGHGLDLTRWRQRPFRAPHHTASAVALVGGGCHLWQSLRYNNNNCDNRTCTFRWAMIACNQPLTALSRSVSTYHFSAGTRTRWLFGGTARSSKTPTQTRCRRSWCSSVVSTKVLARTGGCDVKPH